MKKLILATLLMPALINCQPQNSAVSPSGAFNLSGSFQGPATVTNVATGFSPRIYPNISLTLKQLSPAIVEVSSPTFETFTIEGSTAIHGTSCAVGSPTGDGLTYRQVKPSSKVAIDWTSVNKTAQTQTVHFAGTEVK